MAASIFLHTPCTQCIHTYIHTVHTHYLAAGRGMGPRMIPVSLTSKGPLTVPPCACPLICAPRWAANENGRVAIVLFPGHQLAALTVQQHVRSVLLHILPQQRILLLHHHLSSHSLLLFSCSLFSSPFSLSFFFFSFSCSFSSSSSSSSSHHSTSIYLSSPPPSNNDRRYRHTCRKHHRLGHQDPAVPRRPGLEVPQQLCRGLFRHHQLSRHPRQGHPGCPRCRMFVFFHLYCRQNSNGSLGFEYEGLSPSFPSPLSSPLVCL